MLRSEMVYILAEQLFYRDLANQHQFWYDEESRPIFDDCEDGESYLNDANALLTKLEKRGMEPPKRLVAHNYNFDGLKNAGKWESYENTWEEENA